MSVQLTKAHLSKKKNGHSASEGVSRSRHDINNTENQSETCGLLKLKVKIETRLGYPQTQILRTVCAISRLLRLWPKLRPWSDSQSAASPAAEKERKGRNKPRHLPCKTCRLPSPQVKTHLCRLNSCIRMSRVSLPRHTLQETAASDKLCITRSLCTVFRVKYAKLAQ